MLKQTHSLATLDVSSVAYDEIAAKLREAGYDHVFLEDGLIDMTGIGLTRSEPTVPGIPVHLQDGVVMVTPAELLVLRAFDMIYFMDTTSRHSGGLRDHRVLGFRNVFQADVQVFLERLRGAAGPG